MSAGYDNEAVKSSAASAEYTRRADCEETRGKEGREMRGRTARGEERDGEGDSEKGRQRSGAIPSRAREHTHTYTQNAYAHGTEAVHGRYIRATPSVGEGLPRLGTRKTSFVEYPTGTAQPPSDSFNPLRKNQ